MKEITRTIRDENGIHARPAGVFIKRMQAFPCTVTVSLGDKKADGKRVLSLMKLGAKQGDTVVITADGEGEDAAIADALQVFEEMKL